MANTVRIKGLRECQRAFQAMDKAAAKELRKALVEVARPVADTARGKLARYQGASVGTVRPRATARGAVVTQGARKVTGRRGDFGVLQQKRVLEPALDENEAVVIRGAEKALDAIDRIGGF